MALIALFASCVALNIVLFVAGGEQHGVVAALAPASVGVLSATALALMVRYRSRR